MGSPHASVVQQPLFLSFSFGLSASVHLIHMDVKTKQKRKKLAWHTGVDSILEPPQQLPHITANQSGSKQPLGNEPRLLSTNHLYWGWQIGASQKRHHLLWIAICRCFSCDFWRSSVRRSPPYMFSPWMKASSILLLFFPRASFCPLKEELDNMLHTSHPQDSFLESMIVKKQLPIYNPE